VTVFFLEVLPRLRPGVVVHIHDMFLPFDYPGVWKDRYYSEQYLLAVYLLAGGPHVEVVLPLAHMWHRPVIREFIQRTWTHPLLQKTFGDYQRRTGGYVGTSLWMAIK
jgi:hypothetical protein